MAGRTDDQQDVENFVDAGSDHVEQPAPRQQQAPKHHPEDVELAKHYGFTESEIARLTPEQLVRDVARVQRATEQRTQTILNNYRQQPQNQQQQPATPAEPSVWGDDEDEWEEDGKVVKRKAKDDDFHPALARAMKRHAKELADLKSKLGVVNEQVESRSRTEMAEAIDGGFADLGDEFADHFGTGTYETLEPGSEEAERRQLVWQRVRQSLDGKPRPTANRIRQMIAQEAKRLFGRVGQGRSQQQYNGGYEGAEAPVRRTPPPRPRGQNNLYLSDAQINVQKEEERIRQMYQEGGVEQPTRRGAPPPKQNRQAAIQGVEDKLREWDEADGQEVDQGRRNGKWEV
jgi:hypothetical protein